MSSGIYNRLLHMPDVINSSLHRELTYIPYWSLRKCLNPFPCIFLIFHGESDNMQLHAFMGACADMYVGRVPAE